ncbi:MAG: glycoside hydrolase family 78 protein [Acidobacteria bacterium]|nr:glycoside hydrolase family 78 protein [Acidobacteriota bacterium]
MIPQPSRDVRANAIRLMWMGVFFCCIVPQVVAQAGGVRASNLRCEYRVDPLGIDIVQPRLSWILESVHSGERGQSQSAYRILAASSPELLAAEKADLWDTGKINSSQSIQLRYGGEPLHSQQFVWWKVQLWDEKGQASEWSSPARWSMGLLQASDWSGQWIGVKGGDGPSEELEGAHWIAGVNSSQQPLWFRREFEISPANPASHGLLVLSAGAGDVTAYINGEKVLPTVGKFPRGHIVQTISAALHPGHNVVAVKLEPEAASPGGERGILAGITLDLADGSIERIPTTEQWKVSDRESAGWEKPEFDSAPWAHATAVSGQPLPDKPAERTRLAARMLRKEFRLSQVPRRATLYISGLGYSESYINGQRVGEDVLAPALSDYDKRVFYLTYDVTSLLHQGGNAIGVLLGNGRFYAPRNNIPVFTRNFGYPQVRLQLEIEYQDGKRVTLASDASWKATTQGPIRANNDYDGEEYDARREQPGWTSPGFGDANWTAAQEMSAPKGAMRAQMIAPMRVMREVQPLKVTQPKPGVYVFDLGQNIVGWCRLRISGAAGSRIALRHAERLRDDGMLYTDNLRSARQTDVYILKGEGSEVYEPRFTSHGFRYVEVRGLSGPPSLSMLTGRVVHDALEENADLATSNPVLNQVYQNMLWGDRGNYHSIPTDCPQRDERQAWLGDRSAESKGESFLFQVGPFYAKWLQDIEDSMDGEGRINDIAPAYWPFYNENVVWPASFFMVAGMLHQQYGDDAVIQEHYPAMKRWVEHMRPQLQNSLMPVDVYGDWCVPPKSLHEIFSKDPATKTAPEVLGTAYFYAILRLMSQFAVISGHPEDQREFDALALQIRAAFNRTLLQAESHQYGNGTQTSSILPLAFGMAPEEQRQTIAAGLVRKIENESDGAVGAGLVGMQWILQTLTEYGRADVAYQIASRRKYPSWGYMVERGATTIWELWNGDTANPAMNSGNHLMLLGDFASWLYEDLAGIQSDTPGYKHILIHPHLVDGLEFVRASHLSPYGRIATDWRREGEVFTLRVSIPLNTTATVYVPSDQIASVKEGGVAPEAAPDVRFVRSEHGNAVYEVGSGSYLFTSSWTRK